MSLYDTFLIGGTDITSLARIVENWDGARVAGGRRGSNVALPGVPGELFVAKVRDVPTITLGLSVLGCDPSTGITPPDEASQVAWMNANLRTLLRLVDASTHAPVTVTRRMSLPGGNEEHAALAELNAPLSPTLTANARAARMTLELRIIDGVWHATSDSSASVTTAGVTVTSAGDTRTIRIQATFTAGPATLANTSNGTSVTVTHPTSVDIETLYPAWGVAAGSLALDPGANTLTVDSGTVALTWREAYL